MKITGIIWLQKVVEKIREKHSVTPGEAEQVFNNVPQYRYIEKGKIIGEDVYSAYGRTDTGRYLTVILIRKYGGRALIITARDMDKKEREQYEK